MGLRHPGPAAGWLLEAVLLAGGVLFWLPVLAHSRHRLGGAGRCLYLFLAAPSLDLPAVVLIAHGHSWGGLAMIIAMLPLGAAALLATWRWITAEERVEVARTA
ncbi:hypothetical protein HOY81_15755 [Streptomyces sp. JJ36]|nr:hypothetical protein [Streptomyces sp. JJ36]